jgi:integrase
LFVLPQKGKDCSAQIIPKEQSRVLLEDIKKHDKQLYLACMLEYFTFLRPGKELRLLKVGDIDFDKGTISVSQEHAKNGHKRIVTVPSQLSQILSELKIDKADKNLYVFGRRKKPDTTPCSVNMLGYRFRKYRDRNGLSDGYKLYSMKHQGASLLHSEGNVSMIALMEQLGHSNLSSSQHYVHKIGGVVDQTIKTQFPNPY